MQESAHLRMLPLGQALFRLLMTLKDELSVLPPAALHVGLGGMVVVYQSKIHAVPGTSARVAFMHHQRLHASPTIPRHHPSPSCHAPVR